MLAKNPYLSKTSVITEQVEMKQANSRNRTAQQPWHTKVLYDSRCRFKWSGQHIHRAKLQTDVMVQAWFSIWPFPRKLFFIQIFSSCNKNWPLMLLLHAVFIHFWAIQSIINSYSKGNLQFTPQFASFCAKNCLEICENNFFKDELWGNKLIKSIYSFELSHKGQQFEYNSEN